jgi:formylglycine-generating enzyme required for sulfatase activity
MCGNVNEWIWDYYNNSEPSVDTNPPITGATSGTSSKRVKKGGGFDSNPENDTASIDRHSGSTPTQIKGSSSEGEDIGFGFRVARTASTNP